MESISQFLKMGGYGDFIWSAYGVAAFILIALVIHSVSTLKRNESLLKQVRAVRRGTSDE